MRSRTTILLAVGLLPILSIPVSAEGSRRLKERVASEDYAAGQAALVGTEGTPAVYAGDCDPSTDSGCVRFSLKRSERFIDLEIKDATGVPVYAAVFAPDGNQIGEVCGTTSKPIPSPGSFIDVWLTYGSCWEGVQPSAPTSGTVTATIRRRR